MIRTAGLRWAHLLLGGALLMPYFLLMEVALGLIFRIEDPVSQLGWQFAAYGLSLPLIALTGLAFPLVRPLESAAARTLYALPDLAAFPDRSGEARRRTAAWFTLHTGLGALVSGMTLAIPPMAVVLLALPFSEALRLSRWGLDSVPWQIAPLLGLVLLAALLAFACSSGALLARYAPALLGPTPADRLAAAERRAADLARRNELARELHDSVGHALSAVTLQASAARRVLDADMEFVRQALAAIEETTRDAVAELDSVLGLLREEADQARTPAPVLAADLPALLVRTRAAGAEIEEELGPGLDALPGMISREAYRIVQEGLGNALRHAGPMPVLLHIVKDEEELVIVVENPLSGSASERSGGGRGLRGIAERTRLLGGTLKAGPQGRLWRLSVRLPL